MMSWSSKIHIALLLIVFLLTTLLVVPFAPAQPAADFDSSWQYAMNVAAAQHLAFGRDIVWTVGPLAAVYTHQYHPDTDLLMLIVSLIVAMALFAGLATLATAGRRPWLLLLPLLLGTQLLPDGQFMILPLLLVSLSRLEVTRRRWSNFLLLFVGACCALLPYTKRNLTLLVIVGSIFSVVILWRGKRRLAAAFAIVMVVTSILGWLAAGQQLSALPGYFISQGGIIAGYTDAMAKGHGLAEILAYIISAGLMLVLTFHDRLERDWLFSALLALTLFVCFKMGFVRQDLHASIAASVLGLVGLMLFLRDGNRRAYLFLIVGMAGWMIVTAGHEDVRPSRLLSRVESAISTSASGAWKRVTDSEWLPRAFANANERLAITSPLPVYAGSSDLYSSNLADLFANGAQWHPRPVVQSTSAYTPMLLASNLSHLRDTPPGHIYFRPSPEDGRYPAFEDGASWPELWRAYEPVSMAGDYAVLGRRAVAVEASISQPLLSTTLALGARTSLPADKSLLWATIHVEPTLLGRMVSLVYKLPPLHMTLGYSNRPAATYRFVPGVAEAGFLLSPTVIRAEDFVALASPQRERFLAGQYPVSLTIDASRGVGLLWQPMYRLTLSRFVMPEDSHVDALLISKSLPGLVSTERVPGGDCGFDMEAEKAGGRNVPEVAPGIVHIRGWAMLSAKQGKDNSGVILELANDAGEIQQFEATRYPRVDVTMYLGLPDVSRNGYEVVFDAEHLRGDYTLSVLQSDGSKNLVCANRLRIHMADPLAQGKS
jgi:hypothetical protein